MSIINLLVVTFLISASLLSIQLFQAIQEQKREKTLPPTRRRTSYKTSSPKLQGNPLLRKQLLILLNGDTRTAERLVSKLRSENPRRPTDWCLEKAIYDLERDRH